VYNFFDVGVSVLELLLMLKGLLQQLLEYWKSASVLCFPFGSCQTGV